MAKVLLVTGGIGSGKSFVVRTLEALGVPSYDCDSRAKELYDSDPLLLRQVGQIVPGCISPCGRLDRRILAAAIFGDRQKLEAVEAAVHPALIRDFEKWRSAQSAPVVAIESAIMLEKPVFDKLYDFSLSVTCPAEIRLLRVMERDSCDREQALERMANQWSDERRSAASDRTIANDGTSQILPTLIETIETIKKS